LLPGRLAKHIPMKSMAQISPKKIRMPRVPIDGVLLLDKEAGLSSNDALMQAKRLLNAQKAGHTGTLDPFATGLLPLCFGEATKFAQDLLDADKTYEAVVHLGVRTTTGDTEGETVQSGTAGVTVSQIEAALARFLGEIEQIPPMYSALKRDGKPLYEYARAASQRRTDVFPEHAYISAFAAARARARGRRPGGERGRRGEGGAARCS